MILSIFLTTGAGYYWRSEKIGNYLITQRSVDANCPPCVYSTHSILTTIPDDVEPDALLAAWEVLNYLDNDPGTEPAESPPRDKTEEEIAYDPLVEVCSEEWGVSLQDAETMCNWIMRKQGQELVQRVKKELIQRGLVV